MDQGPAHVGVGCSHPFGDDVLFPTSIGVLVLQPQDLIEGLPDIPLPDVFDSTRLSAKEPEYSDDPYFCLFCGAYLGSKAELQSEASEVQKYIMDGWEFAEAPVTACCGKQFDPDGKDYLDYLNSMLNDDYEDEDQGFPRPPSEKGESEHNHKWD